jgi:hypothetical protein
VKFKTKITTRARLLCPECRRELKRVKAVAFDAYGATIVTLECQHTRGELLPVSAPGRVSLELLNTPEGFRLFPPIVEVRL